MIRTKDYTVFDAIGYEKLLENESEVSKPLNTYWNAMMAGQAFAEFDKAYIAQEYIHNDSISTNIWAADKLGKSWELHLVYHSQINHTINLPSLVDKLRKNTPNNEVILYITIDTENRIEEFLHLGLK